MTKALQQLSDGRLWVDTLDSLTVAEAMDLLHGFQIRHLVWRGPMDRGLTNFAGNWGISFQVGDGPIEQRIDGKVLVIG